MARKSKSNDAGSVQYYTSFQALAAATATDDPDHDDETNEIQIRSALDYPARPVEWLWPDKFPLGKVTLLIGDPGLGKSLVAIDAASRVTTGAAFPAPGGTPGASSDGRGSLIPNENANPTPCAALRDVPPVGEGSPNDNTADINTTTYPRQSRGLLGEHAPGSVLILSAEDEIADTIRPRLDAHGADPAKIFFASELTDLRRDRGKLEAVLSKISRLPADHRRPGERLRRAERFPLPHDRPQGARPAGRDRGPQADRDPRRDASPQEHRPRDPERRRLDGLRRGGTHGLDHLPRPRRPQPQPALAGEEQHRPARRRPRLQDRVARRDRRPGDSLADRTGHHEGRRRRPAAAQIPRPRSRRPPPRRRVAQVGAGRRPARIVADHARGQAKRLQRTHALAGAARDRRPEQETQLLRQLVLEPADDPRRSGTIQHQQARR